MNTVHVRDQGVQLHKWEERKQQTRTCRVSGELALLQGRHEQCTAARVASCTRVARVHNQ